MKIIYHPVFLEHETGNHPENKKRLLAFSNLPITGIINGGKYITLYHTGEYIKRVQEMGETGGFLDPDTHASKGSYEAAIHAVGAAIMASQSGDFALVRPPGHHAYPDHSSGFCIFNNMGIASQKLVLEGKRICIFDIDGHTGDGTEQFFYSSDKVLYISIHEEGVFPGKGQISEIGDDGGRGYTINIPLPQGSGDDVFKRAVNWSLAYAKKFKPDIVGVSAGFDGFRNDPILHLRYSLNSYYFVGKILKESFNRIFGVLEGGYNVEYLPKMVENFIAGVNSVTQPHNEDSTDSTILILEALEERLKELTSLLFSFWRK